MPKSQKPKQVNIPCRECKRKTNHRVLSADQKEESDEDGEWWKEENYFVKCLGCDSVALYRHEYGSLNAPETFDTVYPDPTQARSPIEHYHELPRQLRRVYMETLKAINADQPILAGIGVRALIETICADQNAAGNNLQKKIDSLAAQGDLTKAGAKLLHKLRVLGNKAAHEVKPHSIHELGLAIDVVNNLLTASYILPKHAEETFQDE